MKILVSIITTAFLTGIAFAQEESASPASESPAPATEEKASATVETSKPAEEVSAAPTVAAEKKSETVKAASAVESPKAAASAKPAASAAPAAKAAAASAPMNTKGMGPKDLENAWESAVAKHDHATLEGLIAPDFTGISSKNKFIGRGEVLSEAKGDKDTYKSAKNERLNVKMYGNNVAVVTGRAREIGTGKDGKAFDRTYLFTDTWMMRGGKWQCIASQISRIKG